MTTTDVRTALLTAIAWQRGQWDLIFPNWSFGNTGSTQLQALAVPRLTDLYAAVDEALKTIDSTLIAVAELQGLSRQYTPEYLTSQVAAKRREGEQTFDTWVRGVSTAVDDIATAIHRSGAPVDRPQPVDAAQEAALGNLRADLRMVLDGVSAAGLPDAIADLTAKALYDGDQLRLWFLAGSSWPADYLRSRGSGDLPLLRMKVGDVLGEEVSQEAQQALAAHKVLEVGGKAVRRVPEVWLPSVLQFEFEQLEPKLPAGSLGGPGR